MIRLLTTAGFVAVLGTLMLVALAADRPSVAHDAAVNTSGASIERLAVRAAALVDAAPPAGWSVRYVATRPRAPRAQADRRARRITIFVAATDVPHRVAHDIAHELGHAWDDAAMTDRTRAAFLRRRGAPSARWWPGGRWSDYASGAGDFAEVFARCHAASPEFRSRLAPPPADACAQLPKVVPR
jgi:hypothetical protein